MHLSNIYTTNLFLALSFLSCKKVVIIDSFMHIQLQLAVA